MRLGGALDLVLVLRIAGVSHLVLGVAHLPMWKMFDWSTETATLSPLTRRVFAVHTFFIVFILVALGALAALRPELLVAPGDLARLLLVAAILFWGLRLGMQFLVFDPVLVRASPYGWALRRSASILFATYVLVYAWALSRQLG